MQIVVLIAVLIAGVVAGFHVGVPQSGDVPLPLVPVAEAPLNDTTSAPPYSDATGEADNSTDAPASKQLTPVDTTQPAVASDTVPQGKAASVADVRVPTAPTVVRVETPKTPGPLVQTVQPTLPQVVLPDLHSGGILGYTNAERYKEGVVLLRGSAALDAIAERKLDDMFARQYFAHETPDDESIADFAHDAGYEYLLIGENLARGDFDSNEDLVQAWMNSPGHRANILKEGYRELGVAVRRDEYNGRDVWMAVQVFALAQEACLIPDADLRADITAAEGTLNALRNTIGELEDDVKSTNTRSPSFDDLYEEYSETVEQYNELVAEQRDAINTYNDEVEVYNDCINSYQVEE